MKTIKISRLFLIFVVSLMVLSSCKKQVIKDIDITYQVTATTLDRDFDISYKNDINGEDIVNDIATLLWEKTYTVESDTANQREYELDVYCVYSFDDDQISQTITTRIIEDGEIVVEETVGGTSSISSWDTRISAMLPSKNRYEDE